MACNRFTIAFFNLLLLASNLLSCGGNEKGRQPGMPVDTIKTATNEKDSIAKNGNITTTISTDIHELGKLLDLTIYKPARVKYKYTFIDNSGQNERLSVPGPSDHYLEALIYFDAATFEKIKKFSLTADYVSPKYEKEAFKFDWLDKEILSEIENSKKDYHGHPGLFFGTTYARCWYLDKKILVSKFSN